MTNTAHDGAEAEQHPIERVIDQLEVAAQGRDAVPLGQLIESFGRSSFVPAMMIPALLVISPLSGIPFFSSACGLIIAAIAAQRVAGRSHLRLPGRLTRVTISPKRLRQATMVLRRLAHWLDAFARRRLAVFMTRPARKMIEIACVVCGAMMPLLEIVPFSSSLLGLTVIVFATAQLARDGLLAVLGGILMAVAMAIPFSVASAL